MNDTFFYTTCPCCEMSLKVKVSENGLVEAMRREPFLARFIEGTRRGFMSLIP